jgi:two-component system response regulator VicR
MMKSVSRACRAPHCEPITTWIGIDFAQQGVWRGARFIPLPPRTFAILAYLARHADAVIPTDQLLAVGWPDEPRVPNDLSRHIRRIRQALEVHPHHPRIVMNRRGGGYWLRHGV